MIETLYPIGVAAAQQRYDNMEPPDEPERIPQRVEMVEYHVPITISVLVPEHSASPSMEADLAKAVAEVFLKRAIGNGDLIAREDFEDDEIDAPLEPDDPFEIDTKLLSVGKPERYVDVLDARTIYRESFCNDRFHNH